MNDSYTADRTFTFANQDSIVKEAVRLLIEAQPRKGCKELSGNNLNITGVGRWHNSTLRESHFS